MKNKPVAGPINTLNRIVTRIALVGFIGMLIATWAQVLFRKLGISVDWTEELARVLFITSVFLGIAVALHERRHIVVDFLFNLLPARGRVVVGIGFDVLILAFLVSLLRGAAKMTSVTWESYMIAMSWMRTGYLYLGECAAISLMMVYLLASITGNLRQLVNPSEKQADEVDP